MDGYIINLCPTGMVPTKAMTPHVPVTPYEIIIKTLRCCCPVMGAQMVHIHPRDDSGNPTWDPEVFKEIIYGIRCENEDVIICATTSGRNWPEFEKRSACLELTGDYKPDMASLTIGSMNFIKSASVNSPEMIKNLALKMKDNGIKPEIEVFEPGMLSTVNYLIAKDYISGETPYINILLGNLGTSPLCPATLAAFQANMPKDAIWCLAGIGQYQLQANIMGLMFGSGIRIGLEDNIYFKHKQSLASNEQLILRINEIATKMGLHPAPTPEVREKLGLSKL